MPDTSPLDTLQSLAKRRTDGALVELGDALRASRHSDDQLRLLEQYRTEYSNRFTTAAQLGLPATVLANYRSFLEKLDGVIAQAQRDTEMRAVVVEAGQARWRDARRTQQSYEVIAERRAVGAEQQEARRAQKQSDEIAARLASARLQGA
jgi:flagellar FliJ protein